MIAVTATPELDIRWRRFAFRNISLTSTQDANLPLKFPLLTLTEVLHMGSERLRSSAQMS